MEKMRGKRPVKPDVDEAMKERTIALKGTQFSTMNIPMVYRRTFNWDKDTVIFRPVNRRSFVVMRPDTEEEDLRVSEYVRKDLDLNDLPWYCRERVGSPTDQPPDTEELKEMLTAMSLDERYVIIGIGRPKDRVMDSKLRSDLERLSRDLGYKFSLVKDTYTCTFTYPKHDLVQLQRMSSELLGRSIGAMKDFGDDLFGLDPERAEARLSDLIFSIATIESEMDGIYIEALNLLWDPPQLANPGHFLLIQAHEEANDELEAIAKDSRKFLNSLPTSNREVCSIIWEEFVRVWRNSVVPILVKYEGTLGDGEGTYLDRIRESRIWKEGGNSPQNEYISDLATRIELLSRDGSPEVKLLTSADCIKAMQSLFSINDSASSLEGLSQTTATMKIYIGRSR